MKAWMLGGVGACFVVTAAGAQAVTSFGSSDAAICYQNAASEFITDTTSCDAALKEMISNRDRKSTLVNRGILHKRSGDLQAALDDFNAALEMDSGLAEAYLNRGSVFYLAGMHDRAIEDYQRALDLGTIRPWAAWFNMGLAYEEKNDRAQARSAFEKAVESNPRFADARRKLDEYR